MQLSEWDEEHYQHQKTITFLAKSLSELHEHALSKVNLYPLYTYFSFSLFFTILVAPNKKIFNLKLFVGFIGQAFKPYTMQTFTIFDQFIILFYKWLSDLHSNLNNLIEILFIRVFIVDRLVCLNISLIALKTSKSSLSVSILTSRFLFYCFLSFYFVANICCCIHFHQFPLQVYSHENITESYTIKHYMVFALSTIAFILFLSYVFLFFYSVFILYFFFHFIIFS